MKKLAQLLPGKTLTMIQALACLLLVVIICCVSFGTIFTVSVEVDSDMKNTIYDVL